MFFIFQVLKRTSQALKRTYQALKRTSQVLKYKNDHYLLPFLARLKKILISN